MGVRGFRWGNRSREGDAANVVVTWLGREAGAAGGQDRGLVAVTVMHVDSTHYRSASKTLNSAAKAADSAADALKSALSGCGSMAGGTEDCLAWARDYDKGCFSLFEAVDGLSDLMTSFAIGCLVSAMNDEAADAASAGKAYKASHVPPMPKPPMMCVAGPPSAAGGNGQTPDNWGVIQKVQDVAWPDGDVDKLRAAASAWSAAATAVDGLIGKAQTAARSVKAISSKESGDAAKKFTALDKYLKDVASGCRTLSKGCTEYADHIQAVQDEVKKILAELAEAIGVTIIVGIVFGAVSGGASTIAAGCVTAAEAGVAASRVVIVIARVATFAKTIGTTVSGAGEALALTGRAGALTVKAVKFSATLAKYTLADSTVNTTIDVLDHGGKPTDVAGDITSAAITSPLGPRGEVVGRALGRALKSGGTNLRNLTPAALAKLKNIPITGLPRYVVTPDGRIAQIPGGRTTVGELITEMSAGKKGGGSRNQYGRGKNAQHGDSGRTGLKNQKQIEELESEIAEL